MKSNTPFLFVLFCVTHYVYTFTHELKIYRKPKMLHFVAAVAGELISWESLNLSKFVPREASQKGRRLTEEERNAATAFKLFGMTGITTLSIYLLSWLHWYAKLNKPILIFDSHWCD